MSNSSTATTPAQASPNASAFEHPNQPQTPTAQLSQPAVTDTKAAPNSLISLLAKSLGVSRADWRNDRHTHTAHACSRVSYVETQMTEQQAREFG